jgi:hypothetical protein
MDKSEGDSEVDGPGEEPGEIVFSDPKIKPGEEEPEKILEIESNLPSTAVGRFGPDRFLKDEDEGDDTERRNI